MKFLSFPSTKLNSTRNIFELLTESSLYNKLQELDNVVFINIDSDNLHDKYQDPSFYAEWFSDDKFKVAIVHDVYKDSLPFLKIADHLIFFNSIQSDIVNNIVPMDIPSTIIPYPETTTLNTEKKSQVLFSVDFDEELCDKYLHVARTWSSIDDNDDEFDIIQIENGNTSIKSNKEILIKDYPFIAYFNLTKDELLNNTTFFDEFKEILKETTIEYEIFYQTSSNTLTYNKLLSESEYSYIFNEEMATDEATELIENKDLQIIYTNSTENALLATSLSNKCKIIIADGISTVNLNNRPTVNEYVNKLLGVIDIHKEASSNHKKELSENATIDTLDDLHIISGTPLINKYVFVVNFRNQKSKILRCIDSILNQNRKYDFGIALTDDCSTDGSLDIISDRFTNLNIDHIITRTKERKYSAKNLYNAVHLLVDNSDTVIIELDGDDFLYSDKVLETIDPYYNDGIVKTFGNFITYPSKWEEMEENTRHVDITTPWHQGKCSAWLPLRAFKKHLFEMIELDYFLDRRDKTWLKVADDASINPRMMELSQGKVKFIKDTLYAYDVSGTEHDIGDDWSPIPSYKMLYHAITF